MPLTRKGRVALRKFRNEYGKRKGTNVFYSYIKKHKKAKNVLKWH